MKPSIYITRTQDILTCACVLLVSSLPASAESGYLPIEVKQAWQLEAEISKRIQEPKFPNRDFSIHDFGAVGDGKTDCTGAIAKAIETCSRNGGGRVVIPAGLFLTGAVHLKSGVNLHLLETNSVLRFSTDPKKYLPAVFTRFEGTELYNFSPLIYALGQKDVAVTGKGILDGQASEDNWLSWKLSSARTNLVRMASDNVPVGQRVFGEADHLRPSFVEFNRCQNVLIEGVRIRRSPMWELHPLLCTNVIVRGVDILSHGANNDGCDPESCRDVLIEKCVFDTGDDCIAIKSGRNADGRRVSVPSVNLIIRDCAMRDGHAGVAIGSEISGSCSNVFIYDCEMSSPNLTCVLRLKSNAVRGGVLQNIFMRDVNVGVVKDSVLQIDFLYEEGAKGDFKPVAKNIVIENATVAHTPRVLNVRGFPGASISDVRIYNSVFKDVQKPDQVIDADVKLVNCVLERAK